MALGYREYSHQVVVRLYDGGVRDGVATFAPEAPLAHWSPEEYEDRSEDQGDNQYRGARPQDRVEDRRVLLALQLVARDLDEELAVESIRRVASVSTRRY